MTSSEIIPYMTSGPWWAGFPIFGSAMFIVALFYIFLLTEYARWTWNTGRARLYAIFAASACAAVGVYFIMSSGAMRAVTAQEVASVCQEAEERNGELRIIGDITQWCQIVAERDGVRVISAKIPRDDLFALASAVRSGKIKTGPVAAKAFAQCVNN